MAEPKQIDDTPVFLSQTVAKYKLNAQQEKAVQAFLFDPACKGDATASYKKAGYGENAHHYTNSVNARSFFKKDRILNRVKELTDNESLTSLDIFSIDKMSATQDLKEALAKFKILVNSKEPKASEIQAYIRLIDMQNKAAKLYDGVDESVTSDVDKTLAGSQKLFLQRAKENKEQIAKQLQTQAE